MPVDTLEKLLAVEAIKQLKARYCQCLDTNDWSGLRSVFTVDAVCDPPLDPGRGSLRGELPQRALSMGDCEHRRQTPLHDW
jgi:hypothetical protein